MPSIEQCRAYAAEYKILGADPKNSARLSTVLRNISRSWIALGHQLESLADIAKSERSKTASVGGFPHLECRLLAHRVISLRCVIWSSSEHNGHGRACWRPDPVENDPKRSWLETADRRAHAAVASES